MKFALLILFAALASAQTVPAGAVYQAALTKNIDYISPSSGQAIVDQRAKLNWKVLLANILSDGAMSTLTGGISGVIHINTQWLTGIAVSHEFYDRVGAPLLAAAAPNPNAIAPVLRMDAIMSPTAMLCAENSIYAVWSKGVNVGGEVTINGVKLTFSPQGVAVLKNASGQRIKSFQIVDVLACLPTIEPPAPIAAPQSIPTVPQKPAANIDPYNYQPHGIPGEVVARADGGNTLPQSMWGTDRGDWHQEAERAVLRGGWGRSDVQVLAEAR